MPGCSEKSSTMPSHLSSNAVNSCVAAAVLPLLCRLARTSWMSLRISFSWKTGNLAIYQSQCIQSVLYLYPPSSRPQFAFTCIATFSKLSDEERASSYICHSSDVMSDELTSMAPSASRSSGKAGAVNDSKA